MFHMVMHRLPQTRDRDDYRLRYGDKCWYHNLNKIHHTDESYNYELERFVKEKMYDLIFEQCGRNMIHFDEIRHKNRKMIKKSILSTLKRMR
jgi:hypothetical protein